MAALSLATGLAAWASRSARELGVCLPRSSLADRLGCTREEASHVDDVALRAHVGCTRGGA